MAPPEPAAATLRRLQQGLHAINAVSAPPVLGFLVEREEARAAGAEPRAEEELLVREADGCVEVGLFLDDGVIQAAAAVASDGGPARLPGSRFDPMAAAAEGISHFVYLATRASADRPVSLLELEVQAEVDKFALFLLEGWGPGGAAPDQVSPALRRRLFERVRYRLDLVEAEVERYRTANRLAAGYTRWLEGRFVSSRDRDGLLRELRATYRRGSADKAGYLASRA